MLSFGRYQLNPAPRLYGTSPVPVPMSAHEREAGLSKSPFFRGGLCLRRFVTSASCIALSCGLRCCRRL